MGTDCPSAIAGDGASDADSATLATEETLGIIPRLVVDILDGLVALRGGASYANGAGISGRNSPILSARLSGTYLEIYNEAVRDLLLEDGTPPPAGGHPLYRDRYVMSLHVFLPECISGVSGEI